MARLPQTLGLAFLLATFVAAVAPPAAASTCALPDGYDLMLTEPLLTHFDLGQGKLDLPGYSGPLDMHFRGVPIKSYTFPAGTFDVQDTDTIIHRGPADSASPVSSIKMERLFLQSVEVPSLFVTLQSDRGLNEGDPAPGPASTGSLLFTFDASCASGTLDSTLNVLFDVRWGSIAGAIVGSSGSLAIPHATLGSVGTPWSISTGSGIVHDLTEQASQTNEAHHVRCPSVSIPVLSGGFCPGQPRAVSCQADALRIVVKQGGATILDQPVSESALWGPARPGAYALPPGPAPRAPSAPMYHDDASVAAVSQTVAGVTVKARALYSQCDATARQPGTGTFADVYGQAGVAEASVTVGATTVLLEAGDFKEQAFGTPGSTTARWACNTATAGLNPPPYAVQLCSLGAPNVPPTLTVTSGETTGPTLVQGEWVYTGSNHHVKVAAGPLEVHVYVGYVRIGVVGGTAAAATQCATCP